MECLQNYKIYIDYRDESNPNKTNDEKFRYT